MILNDNLVVRGHFAHIKYVIQVRACASVCVCVHLMRSPQYVAERSLVLVMKFTTDTK